MALSEYFPIWDKLTPDQQERISSISEFRKFKSGTVLHDGSPECMGMLLVKSGQLRAYLLSDEGREVTICRFFEIYIPRFCFRLCRQNCIKTVEEIIVICRCRCRFY